MGDRLHLPRGLRGTLGSRPPQQSPVVRIRLSLLKRRLCSVAPGTHLEQLRPSESPDQVLIAPCVSWPLASLTSRPFPLPLGSSPSAAARVKVFPTDVFLSSPWAASTPETLALNAQ